MLNVKQLIYCVGLALLLPSLMPANLFAAAEEKEKGATYAHIILKGAYPEGATAPGLFGDLTESLADVIKRFDKAANDPKISGVLIEVKSPSVGWGKLNELRQAILRVRAKGKKVSCWMETGTSKDYMLAATCDEIIMPESGMLLLPGLRAEVSFYKNLFDKLDIKADILRVGEFKSAAEPFTRTSMSAPFRKEMEEILDNYHSQMVSIIAKGRKLDPKKVTAIIDDGLLDVKEAKKQALVDVVIYQDQIEKHLATHHAGSKVTLKKKYGKKKLDLDFSGFGGMIKFMNLIMGVDSGNGKRGGAKIAVIHATGAITSGRSSDSMFSGKTLGSETFVKAVQKAVKDSQVKAIVVRVNSPGGSALASDIMWRSLQVAKKAGKPIVISMGDVAASGGYYIAMGADVIYAEPGTLTGSIGVVGGKLAFKGLYEKIGITTEVISRGKNSGILSLLNPMSESEKKTMQRLLLNTYKDFTTKAATGRKMKYDALEKLARGRIYTGAMAKKIGLVDELGTIEDAIAHAKKLAGLNPDDDVERMILPKPVSPFEQLFGPVDAQAKMKAQQKVMINTLKELSPEMAEQLKAMSTINLLAKEPKLLIVPFRLTIK